MVVWIKQYYNCLNGKEECCKGLSRSFCSFRAHYAALNFGWCIFYHSPTQSGQ